MQTKDGNNKEQKSMKLKQKNNKIKAGSLKRSIKLTEKKKIQIINIRNDIGMYHKRIIQQTTLYT